MIKPGFALEWFKKKEKSDKPKTRVAFYTTRPEIIGNKVKKIRKLFWEPKIKPRPFKAVSGPMSKVGLGVVLILLLYVLFGSQLLVMNKLEIKGNHLVTVAEIEKAVFKDGGIKICLQDAGHILGSATVEIWISGKKLVFTGDLGNSPVPILRDPTVISEADYIISESTYGNRIHETVNSREKKLISAIEYAQKHKTKVIIPSFALERTQDLLYILNQLKNQKKFSNLPVILDSPLASKITAIYKKYTPLFDEEFQKQLKSDPDLFKFKGFKETATKDESRALNDLVGPAIYIAGSGMADAGRVQHHILHQGNNPNNQIVFVGYQVPGTLGRKLVDGDTRVRVLDHFVTVKAKIILINAFSAHADQTGILKWLKNFKTKPQVFLVHGEEDSRLALAKKITQQFKLKVQLPKLRQTIVL